MKKISTLVIASLFTVAAMAADRRPSVTIQSTKNYEVVIDGKSYFGSGIGSVSVANLRDGYHTVTIYDARKSFFKKSKRSISTTSFTLRGNDISIKVDMFGKVQVNESRMGNDRNDRDWGKKDTGKGFNKDSKQSKDDHGKFDNSRHF